MKIPYGESDFKKIKTGNYLYIDKTAYIKQLEEQGSFNILLRPRRFGKSLFLSSLLHYYDIRFKDEFTTLFAGLAAGKHPTPLRSSYQVLAFDFSGIATDDADTIRRNFTSRVENCLLAFLEQYHYEPDAAEEIRARESPQEKIDCRSLTSTITSPMPCSGTVWNYSPGSWGKEVLSGPFMRPSRLPPDRGL